jgi:acetylornithine/LysW-gamma-L-lysine aminotransferase
MKLLRYYGYRGLSISKAFMQYVWDSSGKRYVDMHTGIGVAFLGHNNPRIVSRLKQQLEELIVCSTSFHCRAQDEALDALSRVAPRGLTSVAFANSGSEAVEAALKAAWALTGRRRLVALARSFHGRTLGALSVTWSPRHRKGFPVLEDVVFVDPHSDPSEAYSLVPSDAAAVIVELVQGEGGVTPVSPEVLRALQDAAREKSALFIVDEVQTGFGRTGRVWLYEAYGLEPDVLVAGKAIGGGFPVAVVFMRDDVAKALRGRHGSTYAGNPLALAAVTAAVETLLAEDVPARAAHAGRMLVAELARLLGLEHVRSVRAIGLMAGVELRMEPSKVIACLQEEGVLALKAGVTTVRLLPPYMVSRRDIVEAVERLGRCICRAFGC